MTKDYADKLWKKSEIKLLGTAPDRVIAEKLGRSRVAVTMKRRKLGIPAATPKDILGALSDKQLSIIGKVPDKIAAQELGVSRVTVTAYRRRTGIPHYKSWNGHCPKCGFPIVGNKERRKQH